MAGKEIDLGPTGEQVRQNVARIRKARGLSFAELSRRLDGIKRPIPPLGLRRIEEGARRVDIDDLFALATVLWVTPSILLLPPTRGSADFVEATGVGVVPSYWLWSWATWASSGGASRMVWKVPAETAARLGYDTGEGIEFAKSQAPRMVYSKAEAAAEELRHLQASVAAIEAQLADAIEKGESGESLRQLELAAEVTGAAIAVRAAEVERWRAAQRLEEPSASFFPYLAPDDAP